MRSRVHIRYSHPFKWRFFRVSAQLSTLISSNRTHTQCTNIMPSYASSKFKALAPKSNTQEYRKARVMCFFYFFSSLFTLAEMNEQRKKKETFVSLLQYWAFINSAMQNSSCTARESNGLVLMRHNNTWTKPKPKIKKKTVSPNTKTQRRRKRKSTKATTMVWSTLEGVICCCVLPCVWVRIVNHVRVCIKQENNSSKCCTYRLNSKHLTVNWWFQ